MGYARLEDFDLQYATNVRSPYMLPMLTTARGQVIFINSSVALPARRPEVEQYATKYVLKAIADKVA